MVRLLLTELQLLRCTMLIWYYTACMMPFIGVRAAVRKRAEILDAVKRRHEWERAING